MGHIMSRAAACVLCAGCRSPKTAAADPTTTASEQASGFCEKCRQVGTFIRDSVGILQSRGMTELPVHSYVLLGNLELLSSRRACTGCQSVVSTLLGIKEITEPELPGLDARLRFDGRNFFCDIYPHGQDPGVDRGPMLIQTEPADAAQRIARVRYGREMDAVRIDTDLIRSWIKTCDHLHEDATTRTTIVSLLTQSGLSFLYLIDLEQECLVRVPLGGPSAEVSRYVALSYVWGRVEIPKTTTLNLKRMQQPGAFSPETFAGISSSRLPRTIADAMHLAYQLGIRFFWTDCFCIVQDGGAEKIMFINAMASIYSRAYFTIVAGEGPHGDFGIPGVCRDDAPDQPRDITCCYMRFPGSVLQSEHANAHADKSICAGTPWSTRAWTFQEAFFSRRLLVCNGTVSWFCRDFLSEEWMACRHGDAGSRHETPGFISDVSDWPDITQLARVILQYAGRDLTFDDDVLAAFAGATTVLSQSFRSGFHFGLPEMFFDVCLLWEGDRRQTRPLRRRQGKKIRLPSWSWVSVKGSLFLDMWTSFGPHFFVAGAPLPDSRAVEPLVCWRKTIVADDKHLKSGGYILSNNDETSSSMAGWSLMQQQSGEGKRDVSFSHPSIANRTFPYPFPLLEQRKQGEVQLQEMSSAVLTFRANRSWLTKAEQLVRHPWLGCPIYRTYTLRNDQGTWAGVLSDDGLDDEESGEPASGRDETLCELIAISKASVRDWKWAKGVLLEWELDEHPSADRIEDAYEFYNALWIGWRDGVAYRRGVRKAVDGDLG